jgi:hypothetical protein
VVDKAKLRCFYVPDLGITCPACEGNGVEKSPEGYDIDDVCSECDGDGWIDYIDPQEGPQPPPISLKETNETQN